MFVPLFVVVLATPAPGAQLSADLVVTNQPGRLFLRWQEGQKEKPANIETARRGEPVAPVVFFSGCAPDQQGNCNVTMDMVVRDPSGKVYGETHGTEVWVGKPAPLAGTTELAVRYLMIVIEPKDAAGTYQVTAHIKDHVSGAVLDLQRVFVVASLTAADSPEWPPGREKPSLLGFWKDHCEDDFGLKIESAGEDMYSVSFCGPGGCFDPGTYRPNTRIYGDATYRVIDGQTLEVLGGDGFTTYRQCAQPPVK